MAEKTELLHELDSLLKLADLQSRFHKRSRVMLYEGLVRTYLWWREARNVAGFLDEQYEKNKIKGRDGQGEENFTRLLRLIWRLDWTDSSPATLQQWSLMIRKLHAEYEKNPSLYKQNAKDKLMALVVDAQGIRNFIGMTKREELDDADNEAPSANSKRKANSPQQQLDEAEIFKRHLDLAQGYYGNKAKPVSSLKLTKPVVVSRQNYALALVRRRNDDTYDVLDTVSDDELLDKAIVRTYKRDNSSAPHALRLITEVIATQSLPLTLEKNRYRLAGWIEFKGENEKERIKVRQNKRVLFRAKTQDVLLSENRSSCSVVTVFKPKRMPLKINTDVFLSVNDRRYLENAIIQQRNLSIYDADAADHIPTTTSGIAASHRFTVTNQVTKKFRYLYFYDLNVASELSRGQAAVTTEKFPQPQMQFKLSKGDMDVLNADFVQPWLREYGGHITRPKHKLIELGFSTKGVLIRHYGERCNFSHTSKPFFADSMKAAAGKLAVMFNTKDLMPVLAAFDELDVLGEIRLAVCDAYMLLGFHTELGSYAVWVPTANRNGKRNKTAFTTYGG